MVLPLQEKTTTLTGPILKCTKVLHLQHIVCAIVHCPSLVSPLWFFSFLSRGYVLSFKLSSGVPCHQLSKHTWGQPATGCLSLSNLNPRIFKKLQASFRWLNQPCTTVTLWNINAIRLYQAGRPYETRVFKQVTGLGQLFHVSCHLYIIGRNGLMRIKVRVSAAGILQEMLAVCFCCERRQTYFVGLSLMASLDFGSLCFQVPCDLVVLSLDIQILECETCLALWSLCWQAFSEAIRNIELHMNKSRLCDEDIPNASWCYGRFVPWIRRQEVAFSMRFLAFQNDSDLACTKRVTVTGRAWEAYSLAAEW